MDRLQILFFCITVTITASRRNQIYPKWSKWSGRSDCYSSNCTANEVPRAFVFRWCIFGKENRAAMCQGNTIAIAGTCFEGTNCPIDGQWGSWSEWKCNVAENIARRQRECDNPIPKNGGKECNEIDRLSTDLLEKEDDAKRYKSICGQAVLPPDDSDRSGDGSGGDGWDEKESSGQDTDPWD